MRYVVKQRLKNIVIISAIFLFLYLFSMNVFHELYVFEWTARNRYLYLWVIILSLEAFGQNLLSFVLTAGNVVGVIFGQIFGDYEDFSRSGVVIWIKVILISLIVGLALNGFQKWRRS